MLRKFLILAAIASPALADERPLTRPNRDVAVEYRSSGTTQGSAATPDGVVTIRFASKGNRIRIERPNDAGYAVLDNDAGRMILVMAERRMYIDRPADPNMMPMFQATNAAFVKTGSDTVAGVSCTTYDANINDRKGQVCLTSDGVLLRARSTDPNQKRELEAVKVTYAEQPASLFEPPAGFQKMDIPDGPRGMNLGPAGGGPRGGYPGGQFGR
jgi:hypothetical protein